MIWFVLLAAMIAIAILVMMYDEISTGFYRWQDYIVTAGLLYGVGFVLYSLAAFVPVHANYWSILAGPLKALLAFALFVVVWGGTLTLGSLLIRLMSFHKRK